MPTVFRDSTELIQALENLQNLIFSRGRGSIYLRGLLFQILSLKRGAYLKLGANSSISGKYYWLIEHCLFLFFHSNFCTFAVFVHFSLFKVSMDTVQSGDPCFVLTLNKMIYA